MRVQLVATPDPPPTGIPNPIHADDGATGAGYRGALVAGVRTYGWVTDAVRQVAGDGWLGRGWADVTLRRPLFTGETVTIDVDEVPGRTEHWSVRAAVLAADGAARVVLDGEVGLGPAPFVDLLDATAQSPEQPPPELRPTFTLDDVPIGVPLRPLGAYLSAPAARKLATEDLGLAETDLPDGAVHPWFLAGRMAPLTRHNFTFGPTIHVRTQIQHVAPALAEHRFVIGARIAEAYERNEHWYQILVGAIWDDTGLEVARLRHTTIFRPRGTVMPPPIITPAG